MKEIWKLYNVVGVYCRLKIVFSIAVGLSKRYWEFSKREYRKGFFEFLLFFFLIRGDNWDNNY